MVDGQVIEVQPRDAGIREVRNLAGEPRDTLVFQAAPIVRSAPAPDHTGPGALRLSGALSRAALMAGALLGMAELTIDYTNDRQEFGGPVARFPAVQALLVRCAEEAALVDLAVQVASAALTDSAGDFEMVAAKIVAGEAATSATRAAHQAHGAVGMTQEYRLHQLSRRLWSWRSEYGNRSWSHRLGRAVVAHGVDALYDVIADGSASGISL